ncbi:pilus assembly protein [Thermococcus siculi]|uniref:Pilus assembly protein n=1 Tax=Thermococcus siculi TaxID=72803 RepID=A0A2Z2MLH9_9EURY|nr:PIN domain-containing protein [Thermococcus siculi]ASJ08658.1 pilus assembly protein [Thermococcus siculi]
MVYADTDFFLALMKPSDWLKGNAEKILGRYKGNITTSETTFLELLIVAKKYGLDPIRVTAAVMAITGIEDEVPLRAAYYMKEHGLNAFDAFHAAKCGGVIISSDRVYEKVGIKRIKLEDPEEE